MIRQRWNGTRPAGRPPALPRPLSARGSNSGTTRRDLLWIGAALVALLAFDSLSLDLPAERWFADASGFRWQRSWWSASLLHDGGRWAAWLLAGALLVVALLTPSITQTGPNRGQRLLWIGAMLLCAVAVPVIKRFSATSCPWDLAEFGGVASYVPHWRWGVADGGPGHCFPSGHAVAAFAFFGMYFMWRGHDARRGRIWLWGVFAAGAALGGAQLMRGAHYPSHVLWTAWACGVICACASWLERTYASRRRTDSGTRA